MKKICVIDSGYHSENKYIEKELLEGAIAGKKYGYVHCILLKRAALLHGKVSDDYSSWNYRHFISIFSF